MSYTDTAVTGDPICTIDEAVGPGSVDTRWLQCDYSFGIENLIAEFDLPPDIIASTCKSNPTCVAFAVHNSGASGKLYSADSMDRYDYVKLPDGQPAAKSKQTTISPLFHALLQSKYRALHSTN